MSHHGTLILPRTHWQYWADELSIQIVELQGAMALAGMAERDFVGPVHPKAPRASQTLRRLQDGMLARLKALQDRAGDENLPAYQLGLSRAGEVSFSRPNDPRWAVMVRGPFSWLPASLCAPGAMAEAGGAADRPAGAGRLYVPVTRKVSPVYRKIRGSAGV